MLAARAPGGTCSTAPSTLVTVPPPEPMTDAASAPAKAVTSRRTTPSISSWIVKLRDGVMGNAAPSAPPTLESGRHHVADEVLRERLRDDLRVVEEIEALGHARLDEHAARSGSWRGDPHTPECPCLVCRWRGCAGHDLADRGHASSLIGRSLHARQRRTRCWVSR